jgi:hypothetical protein
MMSNHGACADTGAARWPGGPTPQHRPSSVLARRFCVPPERIFLLCRRSRSDRTVGFEPRRDVRLDPGAMWLVGVCRAGGVRLHHLDDQRMILVLLESGHSDSPDERAADP